MFFEPFLFEKKHHLCVHPLFFCWCRQDICVEERVDLISLLSLMPQSEKMFLYFYGLFCFGCSSGNDSNISLVKRKSVSATDPRFLYKKTVVSKTVEKHASLAGGASFSANSS